MNRLLILLALAACDSVVSEEPASPALVVVRTMGCQKLGYCWSCLPGLTSPGSYGSCGFKMSAYCPGQQQQELTVQQWLQTLESGKTRVRERARVNRTLTACQ